MENGQENGIQGIFELIWLVQKKCWRFFSLVGDVVFSAGWLLMLAVFQLISC